MNKTVFQNINLTCVFQNSNPNFLTANGIAQVNPVKPIVSGILSPGNDGDILFQETVPRKRDTRNNRLYEGQLVNIVRRKDGLYYPFLKAFNPAEVTDKSLFALKVFKELTEALNSID